MYRSKISLTHTENSARRQLAWAVLAAFAIRLLVMAFLYREQLDPQLDHWKFGYETGRVARSIVEGKGVANPLYTETGPTAFMTPVYAFVVACVFKLFGIYIKASALLILSLNALTSALTCIPIFFIGRKSFDDRVGIWSGWTWHFSRTRFTFRWSGFGRPGSRHCCSRCFF